MGEPRRLLLILAAAGAVLYGGSVGYPFQYDDHHSILRNPAVRSLANLPGFLLDPAFFSEDPGRAMYRPLVLVSYALNHALGDGDPAVYHVTNVVLHVLAAWALFLVGRPLLDTSAAALAAGLFLVHPLAGEPAVYVSSRSESLALGLWLLAIHSHWRGRSMLGVVLFGAALLAKSTAIMAPAVLWALGRADPDGGRGVRPRELLPYGIVAIGYIVLARSVIAVGLGGEGRPRGAWEQALTQLEAWGYLARLLTVPNPLSVEHAVDTASRADWSHGLLLATALSVVLVVAHAGRGGHVGRGGARFLLLGALLPLAPSTLVPLNAVVSEHRLYASLALGSLALVSLLQKSRGPATSRPLAVATLGVLAVLSWQRAQVWASEEGLWQAAVEVAPGNGRAHYFLGDAYRRLGAGELALRHLEVADSLQGGTIDVRVSLAGQLLALGRNDEAKRLLEPLAAAHPGEAGVLYNLGLALKAVDPTRAETLFARAWASRPGLVEAAMELALLMDESGDVAGARQTLERALEGREGWAEGFVNLGYLCARAGDLECSRRSWTRAVTIDPGQEIAADNLRQLDELERGGVD